MNERIQELALQAGEYVNKVYTPPVRSKTPGKIWEDGHIGWHTQFNQKFAELIVRECISIVAKRKDQAIDDGWNVDEAMTTAEMDLEEHFGVEE
jgi:hypothetical protein